MWFEDPHKPSHRDCRVNTVIVESCGLDSAFSLPYSKKQGLGFLVWWHWLQNHRRLRASQEVQAALAALGLDSNAWIMTQWLLHRVAEEPDNSKEGGTCIYVWISSSCRFFRSVELRLNQTKTIQPAKSEPLDCYREGPGRRYTNVFWGCIWLACEGRAVSEREWDEACRGRWLSQAACLNSLAAYVCVAGWGFRASFIFSTWFTSIDTEYWILSWRLNVA